MQFQKLQSSSKTMNEGNVVQVAKLWFVAARYWGLLWFYNFAGKFYSFYCHLRQRSD